jgi:RNA 3'-terminal phosphate cyclase (ATP)
MLIIDGSMGEGGGQVLRSSLTLAGLTGRAVRVDQIRAGRAKPGLLRQHLCAARAMATITGGGLEGDHLGSTSLTFRPGPPRGGERHFAVGSAGSAGLVLQTILLPLLAADGPSTVRLDGGTHNPASPPADFLLHAFLPLLQRMGASVELVVRGVGFYPAGGGRYAVTVTPSQLQPLSLTERGPIRWWVDTVSAHLPANAGHRERHDAAVALGAATVDGDARRVRSEGPGHALVVRGQTAEVTEVFTSFGARGRVADPEPVVAEAQRWAATGAPVGEHLADQLLLPMWAAGGGLLRTGPLSLHTTTNLSVLERFGGTPLRVTVDERGTWIAAGASEPPVNPPA